jgi:hypothetical protein
LTVDGQIFGQIPPGQVREVSSYVDLSGIPPIQGHFLWSYKLISIS